MNYTYSTDDKRVKDLIVFKPQQRQFTFSGSDTSLAPREPPYYADYEIQVAGTVQNLTVKGAFFLRLTNPCADPKAVMVKTPADLTI